MSKKQKVLLIQAQLAGLGIVLMVFGFVMKQQPIIYIGAAILVFGLVRLALFYWLLRQEK